MPIISIKKYTTLRVFAQEQICPVTSTDINIQQTSLLTKEPRSKEREMLQRESFSLPKQQQHFKIIEGKSSFSLCV